MKPTDHEVKREKCASHSCWTSIKRCSHAGNVINFCWVEQNLLFPALLLLGFYFPRLSALSSWVDWAQQGRNVMYCCYDLDSTSDPLELQPSGHWPNLAEAETLAAVIWRLAGGQLLGLGDSTIIIKFKKCQLGVAQCLKSYSRATTHWVPNLNTKTEHNWQVRKENTHRSVSTKRIALKPRFQVLIDTDGSMSITPPPSPPSAWQEEAEILHIRNPYSRYVMTVEVFLRLALSPRSLWT